MFTYDGGQTFTENMTGDEAFNCACAAFPSAQVGYAIMNPWNGANGSCIVKTLDGGKTWQPVTPVTHTVSISFYNAEDGFGLGAAFDVGAILKTTNGGQTWTVAGSAPGCANAKAIGFVDSDNGYVDRYDGSRIKTTDGGKTWTVVSPAPTLDPSVTQSRYTIPCLPFRPPLTIL